MPAKSLELQHTIRLIRELDREIDEIEEQIQSIMDELHSPITTIPGLGFRMAAMILAEVGDFTRFDSPDKLLAYAGMSPPLTNPDSSKIATRIWKAWLPIPTLRTLQRNQVCLPLGPDFLLIISPRSGRRENTTTLPSLTRPKVGSSDICHGEVQAAILLSGLSAAT